MTVGVEKRHPGQHVSYGTVMVDLDTHRIVDLLPSRETQDMQGYTYQAIHETITANSYQGSLASLRMFMQKERRHAQTQNATVKQAVEYLQRKSLCQLMYKKLENIPGITAEQYETVKKNY